MAEALKQAERDWTRLALERRGRVEPGQGEFWALLASPCGTGNESSADAGLAAMFVRAVAERTPHHQGVAIEPWITPEGIGLLAHGPPSDRHEKPDEHARRVASTLGRALVATPLVGSDIAQARVELLREVGPGPRPGWWLTLESIAPTRPSLLEPRGTWASLSELATQAVDDRRNAFIGGRLRLAVLANWKKSQIDAAAAGLRRWLHPLRSEGRGCAPVGATPPQAGQRTLHTSSSPDDGSVAYVAVPLPSERTRSQREAEWTLLLLNRHGGWLDQALRLPGLVSSAKARLVGGRRSSALVIEVKALPDEIDKAVAQVRALLRRLAQGAARKRDAELAQRHFARLDRTVALDPRHRIVHLWRGRSRKSPADLTSLRRLHSRTFRPEKHVVVLVKAPE